MQAKNSDLTDKVMEAICQGLLVSKGEVLTDALIKERAGNLTMAVFAVLPPIHTLRLIQSANTGRPEWVAEPDKTSPFYGSAGVAFTARDAVVNFFKNLYWSGWDRSQEGSQLFEIDVGQLP